MPLLAAAGHRRVRHVTLSPRAIESRVALDARMITGLADADPVSTWTDRSGGGRDLSASGSARPTYKVGIQGGNPVVRFDSDDGMTGSWSETLTSETVFMVFKSPAPVTYARYFTQTDAGTDHSSTGNYIPLLKSNAGDDVNGLTEGVGFSSTFANAGAWMVVTATQSGSSTVNYKDGIAASPTAATLNKAITRFAVGVTTLSDNNPALEAFNGDAAAVLALASLPPLSLRRRIEQALAFAFKIAQ